ncbi:sensor histidine kinase KdpD [Novosphingobium sp. TH158]|uniref:sensor histidine kinase n=1 Tax=Novosphingobium sp. TH158 TaxID=2067455 RepID=UPI000C7C4CEB|nr:HAMP domain-containing sensor histidine kinase [Novosphingobium sp. TH158]PLK24403.1 hypothetical protein C0V78_14220 [Novosphingobium sp. TH158]
MISLVETVGYIYTGQAIAFSLCIIMVGQSDWHKAVWLISNVFGVIGVYFSATLGTPTGYFGITYPLYVIIAGLLKGLALGDGRITWRRNRTYLVLAVVSVGLVLISHVVPRNYHLLFISSGGMLAMAASAFRLVQSRYWRGSWAYNLMSFASVVGSMILFPRFLTAYPIGNEVQFYGSNHNQIVSVLAIIVLSFFMQVAFIGLLAKRETRQRVLAERRSTRAAERNRLAKAAEEDAARRSEERLGFLRMLTHEVRQPMNNAQAALQAIVMEMALPQATPAKLQSTVSKTQTVLDEIVLTLSNAIAGATLIERGAGASFKAVDVISVCELAILDCPVNEQHRIGFTRTENEIFLDCDPILMRLCLRNLLDNAVRYSPRGSAIDFRVIVDESSFGIKFSVTNELADDLSMHGNLFEKGKRSVDKIYEGYGVGLFIASETAKVHFGTLAYHQASPSVVTFDLFIPA